MSLWMLAAAAQAVSPSASDLGWMAGYWLHCGAGREVSETWSDPRGGVLLGTSLTSGPRASWEQVRIEQVGERLLFHAAPSGQAPAHFTLVESGSSWAIFENPDHDYPQRVIYRRNGDRLTGRIEGHVDGRERSAEWTYILAPLNSRCPADGD